MQFIEFQKTICTCEKFVQNQCQKTCLWSKKRTGLKFVRICWEDSRLSQIFLDKVMTGDESWVFDYDPKTKRQSAEQHTKSSPHPKKACMSRSRVKTMITVFFLTAVALCTKNLYLEDRQLITPPTEMSWNDFENRSSESERTLQTTRCCTTVTHQLTLRFQFENFWQRKTFPHFHILPTAQIQLRAISASSLS